MSVVVLFRIDERLIHGQVVTAWVGHVKAKSIMVVDDASARNPMLTKVLKMAAPPGIPVSVYDVEAASQALARSDEANRIMLIVKTPEVAQRLIASVDNNNVFPPEINMGNAGKTPDRTKITPNVYLDASGLAALKEIKAMGYEVYFQTVPGDTRFTWEKVVKA
ncbi:Phosphotransferase system, sorbose subfamily IIB component [Moorella glycerini]|uniref:PTS system mannose-specific EIIAB component n=1 Tax=Neomoorella stamsii TaxID=1266720 RepID=A0A9X7J5B4_9FIRM|nr:PTS system mannose-specific EIIAB component [Moorella stamsii]CEP66782.1 Phosphotransferase system, sorbose subfamily IIB component [Moorella glycerini]